MSNWTNEQYAEFEQKRLEKRLDINAAKAIALQGAKGPQKFLVVPRPDKDSLKPVVSVGIDPGTNTGLAVKIFGKLETIDTLTICEAIEEVKRLKTEYFGSIFVRIEDARLRTYFGKSGPEKWKGAGSIMRDCSIWETEMERLGIPFELVHPRNVKATTAEYFKKLTGWEKRTSIHAREAAWLII